MPIVSFISTGQGPRDDIMYDMIRHLSPEITVREVGAFDDFAIGELSEKFGPKNGEESTVSRIRDMSMLEFSFAATIENVQRVIDKEIEAGTDMIVILCTSKFPEFKSSVPIIDPYDVMHKLVKSIKGESVVGALFPFEPYEKAMAESWEEDGVPLVYKTVPAVEAYKEEYIDFYRKAGVELLVLDCIGYSYETKALYAKELGIPVVHPRSMIINMIHDLLNL